ncbi:MAG TPA: nucleotidyl transferase AbiEii/AbiGii toxin family protein [Thermoanaerobaculia bacterium]|nr:nucleotidyl transferase AbiEii/AbiGii toxin family protein [Thermoanaerobaculia bacterium]
MNTSFDLDELQPLARTVHALNESGRGVAGRPLIIGATARDLILRHIYGLPVARLTVDLDVAVPIASWADFETLRQRLVDEGATPIAEMPHRVILYDRQIDIVPFGGVEVNGVIAWPPDREIQMTVLGFAEAHRHAFEVGLPGGTRAFVASLPALFLMKVIAWSDRHWRVDDRDARDIRTLIHAYAAEWNQDRLYAEANDLLDHFGYDNELAAAALLGRDAAAIAESATAARAREILDRETSPDALRLASDMGGRAEINLRLLQALYAGFRA